MLTVAQSRSLPKTVHPLMLAGAWLMGSAATPERDWEKNPPKDFDLCIEPQDWPACALILAASGAIPKGHTRFGGMRYEEADNRFDVWISTVAQTAARSSHGKYHAIHLISGVRLSYVR